jgi:hypothetical protein
LQLIDGADVLAKDKRAELRGVISTKPGLKPLPAGHLRRAAPRRRGQRRRPRRTSTPSTYRKEERIRAHVILCWLALLLARVAESACSAAWPELRRQLD